MYLQNVDAQYRAQIKCMEDTQIQLGSWLFSIRIRNQHLAVCKSCLPQCGSVHAYQLGLFLFEDMGLGGVLSKFISRMSAPEIGGFDGFTLPDPVNS